MVFKKNDINDQRFIKIINTYNSYASKQDLNIDNLKKAYWFAKNKHSNQFRKSGELFISHPLSILELLNKLFVDQKTLIIALLHDVLEDTDCTEKELVDNFGQDITNSVISLSKINKISKEILSNNENKNKNIQNIFFSVLHDPRAIIVKIFDRIHNIRTIDNLVVIKQKIIAQETLDIYVPLIGYIGLHDYKKEVEEVCFSILRPTVFKQIQFKLKNFLEINKDKIEDIKKRFEIFKNDNKNISKIEWRTKTIFSIWNKIETKAYGFTDIFDIFAVRIIVKNKEDCYVTLGKIHSNYTSLMNEFRDYIANPKDNLYQALHTVINFNGLYFEVQIRDEKMDYIAITGSAAHTFYKNILIEKDINIASQFKTFFNVILENQKLSNKEQEKSIEDFNTKISKEFFSKKYVYFFDNESKPTRVAKGSTALDVMITFYPDLVKKVRHIKINNKILPLNTLISNSDNFSFTIDDKESINLDWLKYVRLLKSKNFIKEHFTTGNIKIKNINSKIGESIFLNSIKNTQIYKYKSIRKKFLDFTLKQLKFQNKEDFFSFLSNENPNYNFSNLIINFNKKNPFFASVFDANALMMQELNKKYIEDIENVPFNFKVPKVGFPIFNEKAQFISRSKVIFSNKKQWTIYSQDFITSNFSKIKFETINVVWKNNTSNQYMAVINVEVENKPFILRGITKFLYKKGIHIISLRTKLGEHLDFGYVKISIYVTSFKFLLSIIDGLKNVDGVIDINRLHEKIN